MSARWEIVRADAGWHLRFRAGNNRVIVTSEVYTEERGARRGLEAVTDAWCQGGMVIGALERGYEIRVVDERGDGGAS